MTSTINALVQSGPPEQKSRIAKTESPPVQEGSDNRFKDSLEKAMKGDDIPASETKHSGPEGKDAESVSQKGEGKRKPGSDSEDDRNKSEKKLSGVDDFKKLVRKERSENAGSEISETNNRESDGDVLNSGKKKLKRAEKSESDSIDRAVKKESESVEAEDFQQAFHGALSSDKKNSEELSLQGENLLSKDKKGNSSDRPDEPVDSKIIPFQINGEGKTAQIAATHNQTPSKGENSAKEPVSRLKKGKEQSVLTVVDARSKESGNRENSQAVTKAAASLETADQAGKDNGAIVLGEQNIDRASGEESRTFQSRFNENREVMLARELRESGNEQIVKKASFILKDSNQGEIKLILKPEALGRVKIHLDMNENNLVGKIIVENSRVGQIFESNLNNLSKAFEEAGISSSSIEVTVGDDNGRQGGNQPSREEQPFFSERLRTLDSSVPSVELMAAGQGIQHINLVV